MTVPQIITPAVRRLVVERPERANRRFKQDSKYGYLLFEDGKVILIGSLTVDLAHN